MDNLSGYQQAAAPSLPPGSHHTSDVATAEDSATAPLLRQSGSSPERTSLAERVISKVATEPPVSVINEIKALLEQDTGHLETILSHSPGNPELTDLLHSALYQCWSSPSFSESQRDHIAAQFCSDMNRLNSTKKNLWMHRNRIELIARTIASNPDQTMACYKATQPENRQEVLNHIYFHRKPDKASLDSITLQLNEFYRETGEAPVLCEPWGWPTGEFIRR